MRLISTKEACISRDQIKDDIKTDAIFQAANLSECRPLKKRNKPSMTDFLFFQEKQFVFKLIQILLLHRRVLLCWEFIIGSELSLKYVNSVQHGTYLFQLERSLEWKPWQRFRTVLTFPWCWGNVSFLLSLSSMNLEWGWTIWFPFLRV